MKLEKDKIKCYCGKWAKPAKLRIEGLELRGWKCVCGEEYLSPEDSMRISAIKQLKTHPMEAVVTKTGNSFAIRLRKEIVTALGFKLGEKIKLVLETPKRLLLQTG